MANGFADKFFSRPFWERVQMWRNPQWGYTDSIQYVRLGHCPRAVSLLESVGTQQLPYMKEKYIAEHLHNFGVALLCANEPERAMEKLRSAYRLGYNDSTLAMLGLASRVMEWSLTVEVDQQPEIDMVIDRGAQSIELPDSDETSLP